MSGAGINWPATEAYVPLCHICAYVYVNRQDREQNGVVPATKVKQVCARVKQAALELRAPETGKRVFDEVLSRKEAFMGSENLDLPELVLLPAPGYSCALKIKPGRDIFEPWTDGKGIHQRNGVVAGMGPHVRQAGWHIDTHCHIEEVAPTALKILGFRPPEYMSDKGNLEEFFQCDKRDLKPIKVSQEVTDPGRGYKMSPEENDSVRERLRHLGYME